MKYNLNWGDIFQQYISSGLPLRTFWRQYFAQEEKVPSYETLRGHMVAIRRAQEPVPAAENTEAVSVSTKTPAFSRQIGPNIQLIVTDEQKPVPSQTKRVQTSRPPKIRSCVPLNPGRVKLCFPNRTVVEYVSENPDALALQMFRMSQEAV